MITELRVDNCCIFNKKVSFSLKADMRSKRFGTNIHKENGFNILKTAAIYGPNNSGKTCLINIMGNLKAVLLNKPGMIITNFHNPDDRVARIGISFLEKGHMYSYDLSVAHTASEGQIYPYERFAEITIDKAGRESSSVWFERDAERNVYRSSDKKAEKVMPVLGFSNILMYVMNPEQSESLRKMKEILFSFAQKIEIINSTIFRELNLSKTLGMLKENSDISREVADFIKNADMSLDDIRYEENSRYAEIGMEKYNDSEYSELLKLTSSYRGVALPSIVWDSEGTKRMEFLAGYIIEALHNDRILIIDELDTSLHFKLTRAIVAMFNSDVNMNSQLIFSTHDVSLLDCRKLFRKEQIWFINKDDERVYLYPLSVFTAGEDGVRGDADVAEKYRKGLFGSLPDPKLVNTLTTIKKNREVGNG